MLTRRPALLLALAYAATSLLAQARFMGDTVDYADEATRFDGSEYDFGHLWWQPLASGLARLAHPLLRQQLFRDTILLVLLGMNWLAGLACVLLMFALARRLEASPGAAFAAALSMLFSQAFLNFALTGSSYVPGLACVLLSLWLAARLPESSAWGAVGAGAAYAAGVCLWFPYVLLGPAVLLAPLFLRKPGWPGFRFGAWMGVGFAAVSLLSYGLAARALGVDDVAGLRAWMARSAHGVKTGGAARAALGLARSFVFLGEDGLLFKRFLLRDPYNPVSLADLARLSLWKVGLFYLSMAALAAALLASAAGRVRLLWLAMATVPVGVFGILWQGGDMERWLPLYPFLFAALAMLWSSPLSRLAWVPAAFFVLAAGVNLASHSRWQVAAQRDRMIQRLAGFQNLPPGSMIAVARDRLALLPRDHPLDAALRAVPVPEELILGASGDANWRGLFGWLTWLAWKDGGEVWLSKRLLEPKPRPDSTWAEGDDTRLAWKDVPAFFLPFEIDAETGGEDGFVRMPPSPANLRLLPFTP